MKKINFKPLYKPYKNSIYGDNLSEQKFSKESSPHTMLDSLEDIFSKSILLKASPYFIPMVSFNLKALNANYDQKIPVLYHENISADWIISKLDNQNKIEEIDFYDYEKNCYDLNSVDNMYEEYDGEKIYFEEGKEEIIDSFKYKLEDEGNFHINVLDSDSELSETERQIDYQNYFNKLRKDLHEKSRKENNSIISKHQNIEGPYPIPVQNNFCYPSIEDSKSNFIFIGSVDAYEFGGIGMYYFVFFNPEERIIAQLMQMT
jgi:hypothetical protein